MPKIIFPVSSFFSPVRQLIGRHRSSFKHFSVTGRRRILCAAALLCFGLAAGSIFLQRSVDASAGNADAAAVTLRYTASVARWASISHNSGLPGTVRVELSCYMTGTGQESTRITTGTGTVILPPHLEYQSHTPHFESQGIQTVTGNGRVVNVSFNVPAPGSTGGYHLDFIARTRPMTEMPDIGPQGDIKFSGACSGPGGGGSFSETKQTAMFYTRPTYERIGEGPVHPGEEITYKIHTKNYPHAPSRSAKLTIIAPGYTEFVPNSFSGLDGGVVTDTTTNNVPTKKIEWGTAGTDHTVTYKVRVLPTVPANVTEISNYVNWVDLVPSYEWSIPPALGKTEKMQVISVPLDHSDVSLRIDVPKKTFKVNDTFPVTVTTTLHRNDPATVTFADPPLEEKPASGLPADKILTMEPVERPEPFELTPAAPSRKFVAMAKINQLGVTQVVSSLSFVRTGQEVKTVTTTKKITAPPFDVNVSVTPRSTVLNMTKAEKKSARCRELEAASPMTTDPDTGQPVKVIGNCIEIIAKVKNNSTRSITNVRLPDFGSPLKLINETKPTSLAEPLKELVIEREVPPAAALATLEPGAEVIWIWRLNAFAAPAQLEFEPTVFGVEGGQEVGGHGNETFNIIDKVVLKWGMRPTQGKTAYKSGDGVRSDGYIENLTGGDDENDDEHGKPLRVMVYQMPEGNLGGGFVFPAEYGGQSPIDYEIFELPSEGPNKKRLIRNVFRSSRTNRASIAKAAFGVRVWIVEDDGELTPASDQAELDDEGYTDKFSVTFTAEPPIINRETEACLKDYQPIICSFNEAFTGEFADGMVGLYQFGLDAVDEIGETGPRVIAYNLKGMQMYWDALKGNPEAEKYIIDEMYAKYEILYDLGVLGKDVAKQAPGAFAETVFGGMSKFFQAVENGDMDEVQRQTGHFFGANPDLLLEPLVVAGSAMRLGRAMKAARTGIADNAVAAAARERRAAQAATQKERLAAAKLDPNETDLSKALKSGDILDEATMIDVFGVDQATLKRIDDIAKKFGIIMTFRSRSKISQALLNAKKAWPKPQALKHKTVSPIDRDYFGYRADAEGILEIVEPPAGLRDIPIDDENAIDSAMIAYMKQMDDARPELKQNKALRKEVFDRMKTRVKEWQKYSKNELGLDPFKPNGDVEVGVAFEANMQWARDKSGDVGPKEFRKVHREQIDSVIDPATGEAKRVWTIKIDGPGGQPPKPVTGDIDFLAFLDENGHPILDEDKRMAIYEAMYQAQLMEHGESMTFRMDDVRREYLECCVEGAEGMMTVGPWKGPPRVGRFVNNLSVMKGFNEKFKRVRTVFNPLKNGEVQFDEFGKPKLITVRMEDVIGEYSLINGVPLMDNFDKVWTARFAPLLWEQVYDSYKNTFKYYFPHLLAIALFNLEGDNIYAPENTLIYRRGGPILQLEPVADIELRRPKQLRIWTPEAGWRNVSRDEAIAAGQVGVADIAPFSILRANAPGGTNRLEIESLAQMEATGDFFAVGDHIVINPGGANQENAKIVSTDPIVLETPLTLDHKVGEMIAWIAAPSSGSITVSGRVLTPGGNGLRNAVVSITNSQGIRRTVLTSSAGFYSFQDVSTGQNTVGVVSKRYRFNPKVLQVSEDLADIDFVGVE